MWGTLRESKWTVDCSFQGNSSPAPAKKATAAEEKEDEDEKKSKKRKKEKKKEKKKEETKDGLRYEYFDGKKSRVR